MNNSKNTYENMSNEFILDEIKKYKWFSHVDFGDNIVAKSTSWKDAPMNSRHMGVSKFDYIIKRNLPDLQGKRILEIGCNNGIIAIHMIRLGAIEVVGIDSERTWPNWKKQAEFVKKALEWRCKTKYNISYHDMQMTQIPSCNLGKFDIVIALNCLYYISETEIETLIQHISKISKIMLIQCNTQDQKHLGKRPHPEYMKKTLLKNGFPFVMKDHPWEFFQGKKIVKKYIRPVVVGYKNSTSQTRKLQGKGDSLLSKNDIHKFLILPFLQANDRDQNIRSQTGAIEYNNATYFLKTSKICLYNEAKLLKQANQMSEQYFVRPVTFVHYCPENNVLVTEFVSGSNLFNGLWNGTSIMKYFKPNRDYRDWPAIISNIFKWLSQLHCHLNNINVSNGLTNDEIKDIVIEDIENKKNAIKEQHPTIFSKLEWESLNHLIHINDSAWQLLPTSYIHGDLTLANMIDGNSKIYVLDFADTRQGFVLEDVVRLWTIIWEISHCSNKRNQIIRPHLKDFLIAYGCAPNIEFTLPFLVLRIRNGIIRIHESISTISNSKLSLSSRMLLKKLAKIELNYLKKEIITHA